MLNTVRRFGDRLLGRGDAAITVPVMDGALKPNRVLDNAEVVATLHDIDDLATDGQTLYASAGKLLYRLDAARLVEVHRFEADITALAVRSAQRLAVALGGRQVVLLSTGADGRLAETARLDRLGNAPLHGVNALSFESDDSLLLSDGSAKFGPADWCRDLMDKGHSGRVGRWRIGAVGQPGTTELLASGLQHAFGVLSLGDGDAAGAPGRVLYSETWRHRIAQTPTTAAKVLLADLPGYPSRMARAGRGGFWLSCFVCRTQLVEFVLREDAYRTRMLQDIDPRYWIAPSLRSGASYLEPLQGAGVKQMGVLKPWAPPRSYGLVLHVDGQGHVTESFHSQVDGQHHGITAIAEVGHALYAASRGSGRLLCVPLETTGVAP